MKTLVVGASGATGKLLVEELLNAGQHLKIIVRSTSKIPDSWSANKHITLIMVSCLSNISAAEMAAYLRDCNAAASCLGHNLSFKGIYGKPRKLVTGIVRLICEAVHKNNPQTPFRFVLMNTAGNRNRDLKEPVSFGQKVLIGLLRLFLPPHPDNEKAADYLRISAGQKNSFIEWVVLRPDSLTNAEKVTAYALHASPSRSALFDPGQTSRINVAHFMAQLITNDQIWSKWKGQMPVIYNQ